MNFRKNRLAVLTVTFCRIPVAPYNHPEVEKQEMLLRHGAQDFLKAGGPNKGLFGNRSVEPGKFLL